MMKKIFMILILTCVMSMSVFADEPVKSKQVKELDTKGDQEMFALAYMKCGDVFSLFDDAASDNKDIEKEDILAAQDEVFNLISWVHGYLSGRDGIKAHKELLNKSGLEKILANIVTVCKPDETKIFLDVVNNIK